jgi:hypothetical protein
MTNFLGNNAASYYIKNKFFAYYFYLKMCANYSLNPEPDLDPEPDLEPKLVQSWNWILNK